MGKRAAVAVPQKGEKKRAVASPQKAAVPASPAAALAVALQRPLAEGLAEEAAGAEATAEMLCAALPFAVALPKDVRHAQQVAIIDFIGSTLAAAELLRQNVCEAADAEVEKHAASQGAASGELEAAKGRAAASKETKQVKTAAEKEACEAAEAAKAKVADLKRKLESQCAEQGVVETERGTYEALQTDAWAKLKAGEFTGQNWKKRNMVANHLLTMLEKAALPPSLHVALDVAFKLRPDERCGPFAAKAFEHGEILFTDHLAALSTKIAGCGQAAQECNAAVEAAEQQLRETDERKSKAEQESIGADNAWAAQETEVYKIGEELRRWAPRSSELEEERAEKKESLTALQGLRASWAALVDSPALEDAGKKEEELSAVEAPAVENPTEE